ncbi:MAG: OmpA family protein [Proteobacteria bacterium]|nr:OmpA family protein [Pseudomonadota bacterium]
MRAILFILAGFVILGFALPTQAKKKQLQIQISKKDVDLANRTIYFKINRPADSAEIKVFTPEGTLIAEKVALYNGAAAGTRLSIIWPELLGNAENFRLELKVTDVDNYWVGWQVIRFYLEIPHEDVVFETARWDIRPTEAPKLDAALILLVDALKKYGKLMECQLFVAGHTDTVGKISDNRELSQKRARSIANYFIGHGVKGIPIFIRGFGEELLAIETGDKVAEERNRRAQYILSTFMPEMAGPGSWQRIQ